MRRARLERDGTGPQGTFGSLVMDSGFKCRTLELPWRDNRPMLSCIPSGAYVFVWRKDSPRHGAVYEARQVPGRTCIQVHSANLAGDEAAGYVKQLDGCIALGQDVHEFAAGTSPAGSKDQLGVTASRATIKAFEKEMGMEPFELVIAWAPGAAPEGA